MNRDFPLRGASRRDFIHGVFAASAALGLGPTRALEMLDKMGGSALAQAAKIPTRGVNLVGGNGGAAWFQLLFPAPNAVKNFSKNPNIALDMDTDMGRFMPVSGLPAGQELYTRKLNGQPLLGNLGAARQPTVMLCGAVQGHSVASIQSGSQYIITGGQSGQIATNATAASIQTALKTLVPAIQHNSKGPLDFGSAPGAPAVSAVPGGREMVGLFSSSVSTAVTRLAAMKDQTAFQLYYTAFLGLAKTADRALYQRAYADSKVAASLLAKNLASQLQADAALIDQWSGDGKTDPEMRNIAEAFIVTLNAFKLNLTAQVRIASKMDDPHGAFTDMARTTATANSFASIIQNFMDALDKIPDPDTSSTLGKQTVMWLTGDLCKATFDRNGWPDTGSFGGTNLMWVLGQGRLKPGWFGVPIDANNGTPFDPATGKPTPGVGLQTMTDGANSALLYAISGDKRRVADFVNPAVKYEGMIVESLVG